MFENVSARHMKGSPDYIKTLDAELRKVGFLKSILCNVRNNLGIILFYKFLKHSILGKR
jgi:hypothetical protein